MAEEICGDDIILRAIEYSESGRFEDQMDRFKDKWSHFFNEQIDNQANGSGDEQVILPS